MSNKKPIKIAHVAGALTPGGVESVIYNYFSHIDRRKYELYYICYNPAEPQMRRKFEELGFHICEVPQKKKHFFKSCTAVYRILKENKIQIVHSHMTLMCFITNILGKLAGAKVLISHSHLALQDSGLKRLFHDLCKLLSRITATDYFACGTDAAMYLFGTHNRKKKVHILYNAIDLEVFRADKMAGKMIREEFCLGDGPVLGHVGRFTEQKNHRFLLDIFEEFLKIFPGAKLLLAGDGPLMKEIRKYASRLPEGSVIFMGNRQDVHKILQAMDIFVFPSLYEGLPVVLLEAQAESLAILASDTVDMRVDVTDGIDFMSLNESASCWAKRIKYILETGKKTDGRKMENTVYDIRREAGKLDEFYQCAVNRV